MSDEPLSRTDVGPGDDSRDALVAEVFEAYLEAIAAGQPAAPERLLAEHPDIAEPLRACLQMMRLADLVAEEAEGGSDSGAKRNGHGVEAETECMGQSLLTTAWHDSDRLPHVLLRELPDEPAPVVKPRSVQMPVREGGFAGRYQLLGEIARGGMGAILKGRDVDLGRDLALKVLLEQHQGRPEILRRFIEEAQIGGQLQHPGIVPVYELGAFPDERPYFAMKLIGGRTLSALLAERSEPGTDQPRFLAIFEHVCQTIAYAHARGVIHRDLKPSNVMVGSFGEVQVMDWGLAKVLAEGGAVDDSRSHHAERERAIETVRSGSDDGHSEAGSVLGTPAYMAPEQARGEVNALDERSDVFGLGAILCEILTGQPPYVGKGLAEVRARAARGDLAHALARLASCGAEDDLVALARDCLAAALAARPRNAGEVARRLTLYFSSAQERLRSAELARVEAQAKAQEESKQRALADALAHEAQARAAAERKRRRVVVLSAAAVLLLGGIAGRNWLRIERDRTLRITGVAAALADAGRLRTEAKQADMWDIALFNQAIAAAQRAEALLGVGGDAARMRSVKALLAELAVEKHGGERDREMLVRLAAVRATEQEEIGGAEAGDLAYAQAFRAHGLSPDDGSATDLAERIEARSRGAALEVALALDDWATVRRSFAKNAARWQRLVELARQIDTDDYRSRLRTALEEDDRVARGAALRALAEDTRQVELLPAVSATLLARGLLATDQADLAADLLLKARRRFSTDFWVNYDLARALLEKKPAQREEALRYFTAAQTIRPEAGHQMAHLLLDMGRWDEGVAEFRDLAALKPSDSREYACLGGALLDRGAAESTVALDRAIALARHALLLDAANPFAHFHLANVLGDRGRLEEAIAEYREAVRLKPDAARPRSNLGMALAQNGSLDEAIAECREAIRLEPDLAPAHHNLATALAAKGALDEAIAEYRAALRLKPDHALPHNGLGNALKQRGALDGAIAEFRAALRLKPDYAVAHNNLATALKMRGEFDKAFAEFREALRLNPRYAEAHYNFANALRDGGSPNEAVAEYREALGLNADYAEAHCNLGLLLLGQLQYAEAAKELLRGHALGSKRPHWPYPSAEWVRTAERFASLAPRLPAVMRGEDRPTGDAERLAFADMAYKKQLHGGSARLWHDAFQANPTLADDIRAGHRYNAACAAALAGCGKGKDDPPLDDEARARWRAQALGWLKADLAAWSKMLESGQPNLASSVRQVLQHWKSDPDLAGLRDEAGLAQLAAEEREAWKKLWAQGDRLLATCH